jgi:hypothetical protein
VPIIDPRRDNPELPKVVSDALAGLPFITLPALARLLKMDARTLAGYAEAANLPWRQKGFGKKKPRRVFLLTDVTAIWAVLQGGSPWHSNTASSGRDQHHPGAFVLGFPAPRANANLVLVRPTKRSPTKLRKRVVRNLKKPDATTSG